MPFMDSQFKADYYFGSYYSMYIFHKMCASIQMYAKL